MPGAEAVRKASYCRICQGFCAVEATVEQGRITRLRGDAHDPVSHGFLCSKGLAAIEQHHAPGRLLHSQKKSANGTFAPIASEAALAEIATSLRRIVDRHGPRSIAVYGGTQSLFDAINPLAARAFAASTGAHFCGTMTIDQSAKWIAEARTGTFGGGPQPFADADVWMLVGSNPLVTLVAAGGPTQFGFHDPVRAMRRAKARGMKLIVIDPRRSESAQYADLFLQPRPGEDAALLAGIIHVVLREGWHDAAFCDRYLTGLERLRAAVAPLGPAVAAGRAGITEVQLTEAARMFAHDARRGMAGSGTGPDMGPDSNLAEHLIHLLNLICGRFLKEGERVPNPGVLTPRRDWRAQPVPPNREWERSAKSLRGGLGTLRGEMMTAGLADEILNPHEDRIRGLICVGGNPAVALPDQPKAVQALRSLDLLVTIDPRMSATARLAHYVLAPLLPYERADQTSFLERFFSAPYAHFTEAVVDPDPSADLVDDWYVFWRLAESLGTRLRLGAFEFPQERPDRRQLLAMLAGGSQVSYDEVRNARGGQLFEVPPQYVEPGSDDAARLDLVPPDVASELAALAARGAIVRSGESGHFDLIVRRRRSLMNSTLSDSESVRSRMPKNPVFMHPRDMALLEMSEGETVVVTAGAGRCFDGPVSADSSLRQGVVAITHGWGPSAADTPDGVDRATNLFVDPASGVQDINAMPIMTGIAVHVARRL